MNRKTARMVYIAGVVTAGLIGTADAQNSPNSAALDTSLRGAVERKDVPGVVVLITNQERVLYQTHSTFRMSHRASSRTDALCRIASMTKPVTSALMQLIGRAALGPDDPAELPAGLQRSSILRRRDRSLQSPPGIRSETVKHF